MDFSEDVSKALKQRYFKEQEKYKNMVFVNNNDFGNEFFGNKPYNFFAYNNLETYNTISRIEHLFIQRYFNNRISNLMDVEFTYYPLVLNRKISYEGKNYYIDFVFIKYSKEVITDFKIAIELDGYKWHNEDYKKFTYEKQRERILQKLGYTVVRFSGEEILKNVDEVFEELNNSYFMKLING